MLCGLFYEAICFSLALCYFVLVFFSPFSIAITSLGEERANLSAFRTFVRFALVLFCLFTLPFGVWVGLRLVIVALPGLLSYLFLVGPIVVHFVLLFCFLFVFCLFVFCFVLFVFLFLVCFFFFFFFFFFVVFFFCFLFVFVFCVFFALASDCH